MTLLRYHLAQINIARMRAPLDDPLMAEFVARLDIINALAERSPGFVWRLQTPEGDATALRVFDDALILVNMSVWESSEALFNYVYRSDHGKSFRDRQKWFEKLDGRPNVALWWVPAGEIPSVESAKQRLEYLKQYGPTEYAFNFKTRFPEPSRPYLALTE